VVMSRPQAMGGVLEVDLRSPSEQVERGEPREAPSEVAR
jgi:hypothetical protein